MAPIPRRRGADGRFPAHLPCHRSIDVSTSMNQRRALIAAATIVGVVVVTFFLSSGRAYSPGRLSIGHASFEGQCSSCHEPWRPMANSGCIDCHGSIPKSNVHHDMVLTGPEYITAKGASIRGFPNTDKNADTLSCLSCHTDHRGRKPNLVFGAAQNCTFCHHHPSIEKAPRHKDAVVMRPTGSRLAAAITSSKPGFVHSDQLAYVRQQRGSNSGLVCESCHGLEKRTANQPEAFVILRSGLTHVDSSPTTTKASCPPEPSPSSAQTN